MAVGRPARHRRAATIVAVALAVLLVGVAIARLFGNERAESRSERSTATVRPAAHVGASGPTEERAGLDAGFDRDRAGAVAAAVSYATASQRWLYFSDGQVRSAIASIATPAATRRLTEDVASDVSIARDELRTSKGAVWWLVRPLAWRVEHETTAAARVSVWVVTILSAEEVAAPQSEFMTVTIDLVWSAGDWRVDGVRDEPGPTPLTGPKDQPWDAVPFDDALDGFTRMDGEPVR